jgi:hypothetical protein
MFTSGFRFILIAWFFAVFRVLDILRLIRILGSVHWITNPDPDPALFVSGFRDTNKGSRAGFGSYKYFRIRILEAQKLRIRIRNSGFLFTTSSGDGKPSDFLTLFSFLSLRSDTI